MKTLLCVILPLCLLASCAKSPPPPAGPNYSPLISRLAALEAAIESNARIDTVLDRYMECAAEVKLVTLPTNDYFRINMNTMASAAEDLARPRRMNDESMAFWQQLNAENGRIMRAAANQIRTGLEEMGKSPGK